MLNFCGFIREARSASNETDQPVGELRSIEAARRGKRPKDQAAEKG